MCENETKKESWWQRMINKLFEMNEAQDEKLAAKGFQTQDWKDKHGIKDAKPVEETNGNNTTNNNGSN